MPFENPILAGEELIRSAIRSENWTNDPETGSFTGWRISREGDASFSNVETQGYASGPAAAYDDLSVTNDISLAGDSLLQLLDTLPKGIVAQGWYRLTANEAITATEEILIQITATLRSDRHYRVHMGPIGCTAGTANARVICRLYWKLVADGNINAADPNSIDIDWDFYPVANVSASRQGNFLNAYTDNDYYFALSIQLSGATTGVIRSGDQIIIWVEDLGSRAPNSGIDRRIAGGGTSIGVTKTISNLYSNGSHSYDSGGNDFAAANGHERMYQGQYGSGYGNQRSWLWFATNSAGTGSGGSIADMAGVPLGNIDYFDLYLYYDHWYNMSGGTCYLGYHNNASVAATSEPGGGVYRALTKDWEGRDIGKWISLKGNTAIMNALFNGTLKGFIIGNTGSSSLSHYGWARGAAGIWGTTRPHIRAKYTK